MYLDPHERRLARSGKAISNDERCAKSLREAYERQILTRFEEFLRLNPFVSGESHLVQSSPPFIGLECRPKTGNFTQRETEKISSFGYVLVSTGMRGNLKLVPIITDQRTIRFLIGFASHASYMDIARELGLFVRFQGDAPLPQNNPFSKRPPVQWKEFVKPMWKNRGLVGFDEPVPPESPFVDRSIRLRKRRVGGVNWEEFPVQTDAVSSPK